MASGAGSGGGTLRLALVGTERVGDSTLYWFEVSFAGKDPGRSGTVQILSSSLASRSATPRALIVKYGQQPAMKVSGEMAGMMGEKGRENTQAFDFAARCNSARVIGWESVSVPAGTFRALHMTTVDGGDVWASRDVPFGLVKTHAKQGDLALTGDHRETRRYVGDDDLAQTVTGPLRFGLFVLTWVTLSHPSPEAEPCSFVR